MFPAVAAIILTIVIFGNPLKANAAALSQPNATRPEPELSAQASEAPAKTEPAPDSSEASAAVESRIKELHNQLHITAAQQTQWDNLVQVMRDNAKTMIDLQRQRASDVNSMNAVDAVKSYAAVVQAHEQGINKFVPAFQSLYDSMSNQQKKIADEMFQRRVRTATKKAS